MPEDEEQHEPAAFVRDAAPPSPPSLPVTISRNSSSSTLLAPVPPTAFFDSTSEPPPYGASAFDADGDDGAVDDDGKTVRPGQPRISQIKPRGPCLLVSRLVGVPVKNFDLGTVFQSVKAIPLDFQLDEAALKVALAERPHQPTAEGSPPPTPKTLPATFDEIRLARPHPEAYYSLETHEWIVITKWPTPWATLGSHMAQMDRNGETCWAGASHAYGIVRNQIDPRFCLRIGVDGAFGGPALQGWPSDQSQVPTAFEPSALVPVCPTKSPSESFWDAYGCPVCTSVAAAVSLPGSIPAVLDGATMDAFVQSREPLPGANGSSANQRDLALDSLCYLYRVVRETVINGEMRALPLQGKSFQKRMGWSPESERIFMLLGYTVDTRENTLRPPDISLATDITVQHRATLIRAFLELSIIVTHSQVSGRPLNAANRALKTCLTTSSAKDRVTVVFESKALPQEQPVRDEWQVQGDKQADPMESDYLGVGVSPVDPDKALIASYEANVLVQPERRPVLFECLSNIAIHRHRDELLHYVQTERSKGVYTLSDLMQAYARFGESGQASMQFDGDIGSNVDDTDLVERYTARRAAAETADQRRELREAIDIIARSRGDELLRALLESLDGGEIEEPPMTEAKAKQLLTVEDAYSDEAIIMSFISAVADAPNREAELRRALQFFADLRNSSQLRDHLIGDDVIPSHSWEMPRVDASQPVGLRNVGNTCFLNSLLQYLFAIAELRDVILRADAFFETFADGAPARTKRVGGRLVTAFEMERAVRFVKLLRDLFQQLSTSLASAITPERELELLALESATRLEPPLSSTTEPTAVAPSRQSSVMSDSTLVEDDPGKAATERQSLSPSILGKRRNDGSPAESSKTDLMDVDVQDSSTPPSDHRLPLEPRPPSQPVARPARASSLPIKDSDTPVRPMPRRFSQGGLATDDSELVAREAADGVIEIAPPSQFAPIEYGPPNRPSSGKPPALPPRRSSAKKDAGQLLFGKQNDISECLDAMLFKIDIALDPDKLRTAGKGVNGSLVRGLFTGSIRQTLETASKVDEGGPPTTTESLDEFNYILVDAAREGGDLYDALDQSFEESRVEWDGGTAVRRYSAQTLPRILQIQLQRVQYDAETKRTFKSNAFLSLPQILRMNRYVDGDTNDSAADERRVRSKALVADLSEQRQRRTALLEMSASGKAHSMDLPGMLQATHDLISDLATVEPDLPNAADAERDAALLAELDELKMEVDSIDGHMASLRSKLDELWGQAPSDEVYQLQSVFMHRGEANFGHYFVFQRVSDGTTDKWLRFNDEQVTEVSASDVLGDTTGSTLNPYWLAYVRKGDESLFNKGM